MLREHGAQRPTVFELLGYTHRLRGTKSKFSYNIPPPSPLLSRPQSESKSFPAANPLNDVITYTSPPAKSGISLYQSSSSRQNQSPINQGIQARDRVLEAIAPMRRGRPDGSKDSKSASSSSRNPSPQKASTPKQSSPDKSKNWLDGDFGPEQDRAWKVATAHNSATSSHSAEPGWNVGDGQKPPKERSEQSTGFGDNFTQNVLNSLNSSHSLSVPPRLSPRPNLSTTTAKPNAPIRSLAHTGGISRTNQGVPPSKDAFDGLGLLTTASKPAPTLGEARKLRTGLAYVNSPIIPSDYKRNDNSKISSSSRKPSLSPRPNYLSTTPSHPKAISPISTPSASKISSPKLPSLPSSSSMASTNSGIINGLATESRFPSLEELDARPIPSMNLLYPSSVIDANRNFSQLTKNAENQSQLPSRVSYIGNSGTGGNFLKPSITPNASQSAIHSEQVTGVAMRESKQSWRPESEYSSSKIPPSDSEYNLLSSSLRDVPSRSVPVQKHQILMSMQPSLDSSKGKGVESTENTKVINLEPPQLPARPSHSTPRDWLTGDDDHGHGINVPAASTSSEVPVLRGSPSKRASYIELDKFDFATAQHVIVHDHPSQEPLSADLSPTVSKFKRTFPALETIDSQSLHLSDVSDLVDDRSSTTTKDSEQESSSADEGPEDPRRFRSAALGRTSRVRSRQNSVHDLVYQYGGRVTQKDKEHEREREQSNVQPSGLVLPIKDRNKTPSPTINKPLASLTSRSPQHHQFSKQGNKSQPKYSKTPTPGRTRPQSMFIFPSKSVDSSLPSPGLVPPEEPTPRAVRRTSISDIVERFEAIEGKAKMGGPPSPLHKSTKTTSISVETRRIQKPSLSTSSNNILSQSVLSSKASMSRDFSHSSMGGGDPSKSHSVSMEPLRQANRSPTKSRKSLALEKGELTYTQSVDNTTPRPRRLSRKAEPFESVITQSAKAPTAEILTPTNPHRKSNTIFDTDLLPATKSEDRSSSPERPYQGVGKLIDQWQKKTAEADSQTTFAGKRGGSFAPKRVGIVHEDDERGH